MTSTERGLHFPVVFLDFVAVVGVGGIVVDFCPLEELDVTVVEVCVGPSAVTIGGSAGGGVPEVFAALCQSLGIAGRIMAQPVGNRVNGRIHHVEFVRRAFDL